MGDACYAGVVGIQMELDEGHFWRITSDDLPGLFLGGRNLAALVADIPAAIKLLYQSNYDMAVEVRVAVDAPSFARGARSTAGQPDRFVAYRKEEECAA